MTRCAQPLGQLSLALIDAKHRGVEVAVVVDHKNHINTGRSGKGKAA